jgi:DNA recombination-mediator protein A
VFPPSSVAASMRLTAATLLHPADPCAAIGDVRLFQRPYLALLCSVRCPGEIILAAYDLAVALRAAGVTVIGGFHAPMERECLRLLLRGIQPVIVCPARGVERMRVPAEWKEPMARGRLLVVSPFAAGVRRATKETARERNRFVARMADAVLVVHATPGGKMEALCHEIAGWGKPLLTFASAHNANVMALGARAVRAEAVGEWWPVVATV